MLIVRCSASTTVAVMYKLLYFDLWLRMMALSMSHDYMHVHVHVQRISCTCTGICMSMCVWVGGGGGGSIKSDLAGPTKMGLLRA